MPVVRGDRIGESQKLNRCTVEAQDFYGLFASSVPDDFGRFRVSAVHVAVRMYPRREPTVALLRRIERLMHQLGKARLWKTWQVDGVTFGEMTGWSPSGNLYHRTPEPPWKLHVHTRRCATTAISRAKEWKDHRAVKALSLFINKKGGTEAEQEPSRSRAEVEHPSPPSPPSHNETTPPLTPPPSREVGEIGPLDLPPGMNGNDRLGRKAIEASLEDARRYAIRLGFRPDRDDLRYMRSWVKAGRTPDEIRRAIEITKENGDRRIAPQRRKL